MSFTEKAKRKIKDELKKVPVIVKVHKHFKQKRSAFPVPREMVDVCFINGCDPIVPHPPRYRVTHQREQLGANHVSTSEIFYTDVNPEEDVRFANMFIIFRCPYTEAVGELIRLAKSLNKTVWYDVDDLVIDTRFTDLLPYTQGLNPQEKGNYDGFVNSLGRTMKLCDGVITTTAGMKKGLEELGMEVFVNRNTASDEMYMLSEEALSKKSERKDQEVRIGYFSGSITHNADVAMIIPVLAKIMKRHKNVRLYIAGELDLPKELAPFQSQVVTFPFMDWHKLPELIASVDINLAPIEDTVFNRAKSENKWVEAALVKTVTIASGIGAFEEMVEDGVTGVLCADESEWETKLEELVTDAGRRETISLNVYNFVKENCVTIYSGAPLADFIKSKLQKTAVVVLPTNGITGGIMVAMQHVLFLYEEGYTVTALVEEPTQKWMEFHDVRFPEVFCNFDIMRAYYKIGIATFFRTTSFLENYGSVENKFYLVQNYETDLFPPGDMLRAWAESTYHIDRGIEYVTISRWCQDWLENKYHKPTSYVPNGIDRANFPKRKRCFDKDRKIRILIEGDSTYARKGVDESFKIANALDPDRFETWYLSYNGKAKDWYRVDKFFHSIPYGKVGKIYKACDILIKSSWLESFSYPPIEMMTSGGFVVVVPNGGNVEYLKDHVNCLFYEQGNIEQGIACVKQLVEDEALREELLSHYEETIAPREWSNLKQQILELYRA